MEFFPSPLSTPESVFPTVFFLGGGGWGAHFGLEIKMYGKQLAVMFSSVVSEKCGNTSGRSTTRPPALQKYFLSWPGGVSRKYLTGSVLVLDDETKKQILTQIVPQLLKD